jgi:hypothetical protein
VQVLAQEHSSGLKVGQQFFTGGYLLFHLMATIVDDDVNARHLLLEHLPKRTVLLIADEDAHRITRVRCRHHDVALRTEVLPPHVEAATAVDSDFKNMNFSV